MLLIKNRRLREVFGLVETLNILMIRLALRNREAVRSFPGKIFRTYMANGGKAEWRSKSWSDIANLFNISGLRINVEYLTGEGIFTPVDELAYLALLTAAIQPQTVFEFGTFRGRTALNFAINAPHDACVYTLDLPKNSPRMQDTAVNAADAEIIQKSLTGIDYIGKPESEKIRQLYGDSLTFDFTPFYGSADIVFVDGAHHYEAVKRDTANALRIVKPNGVVLWHDFANYGDYNDVTRAVVESVDLQRFYQVDSTQLAMLDLRHGFVEGRFH